MTSRGCGQRAPEPTWISQESETPQDGRRARNGGPALRAAWQSPISPPDPAAAFPAPRATLQDGGWPRQPPRYCARELEPDGFLSSASEQSSPGLGLARTWRSPDKGHWMLRGRIHSSLLPIPHLEKYFAVSPEGSTGSLPGGSRPPTARNASQRPRGQPAVLQRPHREQVQGHAVTVNQPGPGGCFDVTVEPVSGLDIDERAPRWVQDEAVQFLNYSFFISCLVKTSISPTNLLTSSNQRRTSSASKLTRSA